MAPAPTPPVPLTTHDLDTAPSGTVLRDRRGYWWRCYGRGTTGFVHWGKSWHNADLEPDSSVYRGSTRITAAHDDAPFYRPEDYPHRAGADRTLHARELGSLPIGTIVEDSEGRIWKAVDTDRHAVTRWVVFNNSEGAFHPDRTAMVLTRAEHIEPFVLNTPAPTQETEPVDVPAAGDPFDLDTAHRQPVGTVAEDKDGDLWEATLVDRSGNTRWSIRARDTGRHNDANVLLAEMRPFGPYTLHADTVWLNRDTPATPRDFLADFIAAHQGLPAAPGDTPPPPDPDKPAPPPPPAATPFVEPTDAAAYVVGFVTPTSWGRNDTINWLERLPHRATIIDNDGDAWQRRIDLDSGDYRWRGTYDDDARFDHGGIVAFGPFQLVHHPAL